MYDHYDNLVLLLTKLRVTTPSSLRTYLLSNTTRDVPFALFAAAHNFPNSYLNPFTITPHDT
jgi:hypothetical protein